MRLGDWQTRLVLTATIDPGAAEHLARTGSNGFVRAAALAGVGRVLMPTDPARAALLLDEAEQDALTIRGMDLVTDGSLGQIATAWAAVDPDRAERLARAIPDDDDRASALCDIATALFGRPVRPLGIV